MLAGLRLAQKRLDGRLLCDPDAWLEFLSAAEHYPTRRERELIPQVAPLVRQLAGAHARVIEMMPVDFERSLGFVRALEQPAVYAATGDGNEELIRAMEDAVPGLEGRPILADGSSGPYRARWERTVVYVSDTRLGNMEPAEAVRQLTTLGELAGPEGVLVLANDATHDLDMLLSAYGGGAAATLARNVLDAAAKIADVGLDPDAFAYAPIWHPQAARLDLQVVSTRRQLLDTPGALIEIAAGEAITLGQLHKHVSETVSAILSIAGWFTRHVVTSTPEPVRIWVCERIPIRRSQRSLRRPPTRRQR